MNIALDVIIIAILVMAILVNVVIFLIRKSLILPVNKRKLPIEDEIPVIQSEGSILPLTEQIEYPKQIAELPPDGSQLDGPRDLTEWKIDPIWVSNELLQALPELMTPQ